MVYSDRYTQIHLNYPLPPTKNYHLAIAPIDNTDTKWLVRGKDLTHQLVSGITY